MPGLGAADLALGHVGGESERHYDFFSLGSIHMVAYVSVGTAWRPVAAIGGGGLGVFIFRGLASVDTTLILAGAIPAAAIALLADGGLGWVEHKFSAA